MAATSESDELESLSLPGPRLTRKILPLPLPRKRMIKSGGKESSSSESESESDSADSGSESESQSESQSEPEPAGARSRAGDSARGSSDAPQRRPLVTRNVTRKVIRVNKDKVDRKKQVEQKLTPRRLEDLVQVVEKGGRAQARVNLETGLKIAKLNQQVESLEKRQMGTVKRNAKTLKLSTPVKSSSDADSSTGTTNSKSASVPSRKFQRPLKKVKVPSETPSRLDELMDVVKKAQQNQTRCNRETNQQIQSLSKQVQSLASTTQQLASIVQRITFINPGVTGVSGLSGLSGLVGVNREMLLSSSGMASRSGMPALMSDQAMIPVMGTDIKLVGERFLTEAEGKLLVQGGEASSQDRESKRILFLRSPYQTQATYLPAFLNLLARGLNTSNNHAIYTPKVGVDGELYIICWTCPVKRFLHLGIKKATRNGTVPYRGSEDLSLGFLVTHALDIREEDVRAKIFGPEEAMWSWIHRSVSFNCVKNGRPSYTKAEKWEVHHLWRNISCFSITQIEKFLDCNDGSIQQFAPDLRFYEYFTSMTWVDLKNKTSTHSKSGKNSKKGQTSKVKPLLDGKDSTDSQQSKESKESSKKGRKEEIRSGYKRFDLSVYEMQTILFVPKSKEQVMDAKVDWKALFTSSAFSRLVPHMKHDDPSQFWEKFSTYQCDWGFQFTSEKLPRYSDVLKILLKAYTLEEQESYLQGYRSQMEINSSVQQGVDSDFIPDWTSFGQIPPYSPLTRNLSPVPDQQDQHDQHDQNDLSSFSPLPR